MGAQNHPLTVSGADLPLLIFELAVEGPGQEHFRYLGPQAHDLPGVAAEQLMRDAAVR